MSVYWENSIYITDQHCVQNAITLRAQQAVFHLQRKPYVSSENKIYGYVNLYFIYKSIVFLLTRAIPPPAARPNVTEPQTIISSRSP